MDQHEAIASLYRRNLSTPQVEKNFLIADCPFCREKGFEPQGRFVVFLKKESFFYGYFRCFNRCVPGGFPLWFVKLSGLDPDRELLLKKTDYLATNLNQEIRSYRGSMTNALLARFLKAGVGEDLLVEQGVGFNGRYLVYPYVQEDGNCYAARCVFPGRKSDFFWHGDETTFAEKSRIFKGSGDIEYSTDNAMVLFPDWDPLVSVAEQKRKNKLWLVASREHSPGFVADYELDYPFWGFVEREHQ